MALTETHRRTITTTAGTDAERFRERVAAVVADHPVVVGNSYTTWFAEGGAGLVDVRHLTVQFSVFSHLFLEAQLRKVIHAATLDSYRAGKEILLNELGVVFKPQAPEAGARAVADGVDPHLVATEGTVDGGRFRFAAAHFEWLIRFAKPLGLTFDDLGKRHQATPATAHFCDELLRIYGSTDPSTAEGASYAVEHWAAAGFWKQLIAGLEAFRDRDCPDLHLAFWTWHDEVEDQHAAHTDDELSEAFGLPGFDEERFVAGATEMLDAVARFWEGLDADRHRAAGTAGVVA